MQAVILAGGLGTRLSEETHLKPKPMVEIGGMPILWHIMKIYAAHGVNDFIICLGYKGEEIKKFFSQYLVLKSDLQINFSSGAIKRLSGLEENWRVKLIDTGLHTMTGGRLKRIKKLLKPSKPFFFTYGDGVGDVDISASLEFHNSHSGLCTMTTAFPPGRFGAVSIDGHLVTSFTEKPKGEQGMVNAGFFE